MDVRVLAPDAQPVPRFEARLAQANGYRKLGQQTDGRFVISPPTAEAHALPPGSVLEIWGARDAKDYGLGLSPQRVGPFTGSERTLEVLLEAGPVLEGVVLGPDGPLATSVEVKLGPLDRWWEGLYDRDLIDAGLAPPSSALPPRLPFEGLGLSVRTDGSGRFRVAFLRPGIVHELEIDVPEEFCEIERREVQVGDGPLEIRLQRPPVVRVTVLGPDLQPLVGAHVTVLSPGGNGFGQEASATTKADGVALLGAKDEEAFSRPGRLDPTRKYKLVVNTNYGPGIVRDERPWLLTRDVKPVAPPFLAEKALDIWIPADTTIQLEHGHVVSGTVLDATGRPLQGRHVGMCTPAGFGVYTTDLDGRFVFRGVPAGAIYMGLDDGGDMGGIVDRQRETMWDASFGARRKYSPESPPPVVGWTKLEVGGDLNDVTFRLPATLGAQILLPPPSEDEVRSDDDEFSTRRFAATRVTVLHLTEKGWVYLRSLNSAFGEMRGKGNRTVKLDVLLPGHTYAAWMTPVSGAYVYVEFPAEVGSLSLERKPGGTIRGRILDRPPDASRVRIDVWDDRKRAVGTRTPDPDGGFHVDGLPESTWTVRAWCRSADDLIWQAEGRVRTGDQFELHLAPQPRKEDK